jgi:hypothetical protein
VIDINELRRMVEGADTSAWVVCVSVALTFFIASAVVLRARRKPPEFVLSPEASAAFFESETGWHPLPDSGKASDAGDRRKASRRPGNFIPVHLSDAQARARPKRAWVLDRSTGGLRIAADRELPAGVILSVKAENAPDNTPWIQVQIRSCRPNEKFFELGCQFLQTPPWSILLLFG